MEKATQELQAAWAAAEVRIANRSATRWNGYKKLFQYFGQGLKGLPTEKTRNYCGEVLHWFE